jgi:hypothetical protein
MPGVSSWLLTHPAPNRMFVWGQSYKEGGFSVRMLETVQEAIGLSHSYCAYMAFTYRQYPVPNTKTRTVVAVGILSHRFGCTRGKANRATGGDCNCYKVLPPPHLWRRPSFTDTQKGQKQYSAEDNTEWRHGAPKVWPILPTGATHFEGVIGSRPLLLLRRRRRRRWWHLSNAMKGHEMRYDVAYGWSSIANTCSTVVTM